MALPARHLSTALVTGQMMLAIALMSGAGVLGHSLWNVLTADIGVRSPETILVGHVSLPAVRYSTGRSRAAFFDTLGARLASIPGVTSASVASGRPVDDFDVGRNGAADLRRALLREENAPVEPQTLARRCVRPSQCKNCGSPSCNQAR